MQKLATEWGKVNRALPKWRCSRARITETEF
jgi:hypothetical protein